MSSQRQFRVWLAFWVSVVASLALGSRLVAEDGKVASAGRGFEWADVWQVHLRFSPEEFEAMQPRSSAWFPGLKNLFTPKSEQPARQVHPNNFGMDLPWAKGTVALGNDTFKDVGIRYKGNGTIGDAAGTMKKSLKIDLDHFGGTTRYRGRKTINLHCAVADPSKLRETLAYAVYRSAGVPGCRTAFAEVRLTVPGKYDRELLGLYTVVEPVDKEFLRDRFGTDDGLLMKPEGLRDFEYKGDDWNSYKKQYLPKREPTADESKRVIAFARLVHKAGDDEFRKEIGSYVDVDAYLRFLAATAYLSNTDSFFALGHNYYVYLHPKTGRLHFFAWDLDRAFANFPIFGSKNRQMDLSLRRPYPGKHRLTDRLLATPEISARYDQLLQELGKTAFQKERLLRDLEVAEAIIQDLLARDLQAAAARKEDPANAGFNAIFGQPPELKTFVAKRSASLAAQLAGDSQGYVPTGGFGPGFPKIADMMAGPLMESLDADKDDRLSRDEWRAIAVRVYDACAKDDQGRVNEKAIADAMNGMFPKPPGDKKGGPFPFSLGAMLASPLMKRIDPDRKGLTRDELLGAADKLFDQFDPEKTGHISEEAFVKLLSELFPAPNFGPPRPAGDGPAGEAKKK